MDTRFYIKKKQSKKREQKRKSKIQVIKDYN